MKIHTFQVCLLLMTSFILNSCSSMMTHSGNDKPYYPGTLANNETISDEKNTWSVRMLAVIDYPFSLLLDTVLLPWDYFHHTGIGGKTLRDRVTRADAKSQRK